MAELMRPVKGRKLTHLPLPALNRLRQQVRQITSLMSDGGNIREQMGGHWACNMEQRTIIWRPTSSFPPNDVLTYEQFIFNVGHEAGHIKFSGGYETPDSWDKRKKSKFQRWWNGIEDIRIERLMGLAYPGFEELRKPDNCDVLSFHAEGAYGSYDLISQVSFQAMAKEVDFEDFPDDDARKILEANWKLIDNACNMSSSDELAQAITPLFEKLYEEDAQDAMQEPDMDGMVIFGKPSDLPAKSPGNPIILSKFDVLVALAMEMKGEALDELNEVIKAEIEERDASKQPLNFLAIGPEGPTGHRAPDDSWDTRADEIKGQIVALTRKLLSTLRNNAMDNYGGGFRRGKFDSRRAYKTVYGNNRVFKRKNQPGKLNYIIGLTIDCSGSMSGDAADNALTTSVLIAEACQRAGIPNFLIPWEAGLHPIKRPRDKWTKENRAALGAIIGDAPGPGTYEAPALLEATELFRQWDPSAIKVLISVTDGGTVASEESTALLADLRKDGVETYNIAIDYEPGAHYEHRIRVQDSSELVRLIPKIISDKFTKGFGQQ